MPNRLAATHSPYLLQHADNPVDWWPWSDDAFAEAERRGVPVFLSIGYATCHWCHVMEHESFEDPEAARALNEAFVCIKVDREERPDVDGIYMAACLALNGSGGWPLTALLTPDTREPFWVGTYLPKESRRGRVGVLDLAANVSHFWRENEGAARQSASEIAGHIRTLAAPPVDPDALGADWRAAVADGLRRRFDADHGGFGGRPKFPTPHDALFLLRQAQRTGEDDLTAMAVDTLRAIRRGGIWDHVGGGIHRYSTDRAWLLPHFEKMLYDQALYALACTEAWWATGAGDLREAAEATLDYVLRDLRSPDGAFFSAEDADSLNADGEREEGAFYVWTEAELADALGEDEAAFAREIWGTRPGGNYLDEATRQPTGANVLHHPVPVADLAERLGLTPDALRQREASVRARLHDARSTRPRPLLDDKVLTDWNGLAIAAFAVAGRLFERDDYTEAATRAADAVLGALRTDDGGTGNGGTGNGPTLLHRLHRGQAGIDATLDDYAFLAWGLVELYQSTFDERRLADVADPARGALVLYRQLVDRFGSSDGGFFSTASDTPDLLARQRSLDDGAIPAGNSIAVLVGLRLAQFTGDAEIEAAARRGLQVPQSVREYPSGFTALGLAVLLADGPAPEVVLAGDRGAADIRSMLTALRAVYAPDAVIVLRAPGDGPAPIVDLVPFTAEQTARAGRATAYVCQGGACQAPTTDAGQAADTLRTLVTP